MGHNIKLTGKRYQTSLGREFKPVYDEAKDMNSLVFATVVKVNYRFNTVDVVTTKNADSLVKPTETRGKLSARLPVTFGGSLSNGKPYGDFIPITEGDTVLIGFVDGLKDNPIVVNIYKDNETASNIAPFQAIAGDPESGDLLQGALAYSKVYPYQTMEHTAGNGDHTHTFPGRTAFTVRSTTPTLQYTDITDEYNINPGVLPNGLPIDPTNTEKPQMFLTHRGTYDRDIINALWDTDSSFTMSRFNADLPEKSSFRIVDEKTIIFQYNIDSLDNTKAKTAEIGIKDGVPTLSFGGHTLTMGKDGAEIDGVSIAITIQQLVDSYTAEFAEMKETVDYFIEQIDGFDIQTYKEMQDTLKRLDEVVIPDLSKQLNNLSDEYHEFVNTTYPQFIAGYVQFREAQLELNKGFEKVARDVSDGHGTFNSLNDRFVANEASVTSLSTKTSQYQQQKITKDDGKFKLIIKNNVTDDVYTQLLALPTGAHTVYIYGGLVNGPPITVRGIAFVEQAGTYMSVLGSGSDNKIYSNYFNVNTVNKWSGWGSALTTTSRDNLYSNASLPFSYVQGAGKVVLSDPKALPVGEYLGDITKDVTIDMPVDVATGSYFLTKRTTEPATASESYTLRHASLPITWEGVRVGSTVVWRNNNPDAVPVEDDVVEWVYDLKERRTNIATPFTFLTVTDTHLDKAGRDITRSNYGMDAVRKFTKASELLNYDFKAHLGDWIDGTGTKGSSYGDVLRITTPFFNDKKSMGVVGNHDFNSVYMYLKDKQKLSDYYTNAEVKEYFHKTTLPSTVYKDQMYYTDFPDSKVRVICLNSWDNPFSDKGDGTPNIKVLITSSYGKKQVQDLVDTLSATPNDYQVIVLNHDSYDGVYDGTYARINSAPVRAIIEAFQSSTSVTVTTTGIEPTNKDYAYYNMSITANFTGKPTKRVIACFSGHVHADKFKSLNGVSYVISTCATLTDGSLAMTRNSTAFDLVDVDKSNRKVYMYRYGVGSDRTFTY